jgi:hypothetical protein
MASPHLAPCTLRGCMALSARSRKRWRALFEVPSGRSPGRNKLRSQVRTGHAVSPLLKQWLPNQPLLPFLVCALGEQRKLPSLPILHFAEPSSDRS